METGLVLSLRNLEPALRRWRGRDPAAKQGMPPHVTLIYPFMDSRAVDEAVRERVRRALAGFAALDIVFDRLGTFPGGLWLEPVDPAPVLALIAALEAAFPAYPPFGGAFETVIPHLTIAQAAPAQLSRIAREAPAILPLAARAEAVTLFARSEEGWIPVERFELGG